MACTMLYAQQYLSSPVTASRNVGKAGELRWQNADGSYFGFKGSTKGSNVTVQLPSTTPTTGNCLGYISAGALDWVPCSAGAGYDPTLGILMTNSTNTGVTGTGDGGHYYWDTVAHVISIQSWFSGSIAPVLFNASFISATSFHGNVILSTTPTLCAVGSYARGVDTSINAASCVVAISTDASNGILMNNSTTTGATGTADGGHFYWSTTNHWLEIQSWYNPGSGSAVAPINMNSASFVSAISFHGNVLLSSTPTLCSAGSYSRGVDININSTGCTIAVATDAGSGIYMTTNTTTGATGTGDGGHFYWNTSTHLLSIQSWFSSSLAPVSISASSVLFSNGISLGTTPTLCTAGNYARGVDTSLNASGCTVAAGGVDPTIGFRINNKTGTNANDTTTGLHLFYDTSVNESHIESYQSGSGQVLVLQGNTVVLNGSISAGGNMTPGLDNNYNNGTSANRWADVRAVTTHFGSTPLDTPSGLVSQNVCTSSPCLVVADSTASGGIAAFITRSGGSGALANNSTVGVYGSRGYDGSWASTTAASMVMTTTQAWTGGGHGMNITFNTTANASLAAASRLVIDSNGLTVNSMTGGSSRAVCVTSAGLIYAAVGTTCP